ncbi:hypothetical protein DIPPA_27996 [Diplonema papillatum]|nr:hypothetical protein DIPPA_27996 [Diplonema papillatum]
MSMYGQVRDYWHGFSEVFSRKSPLLAISAHQRETKPWYACPRNPIVDGVRCDLAPFMGENRRGSDNPGKWIVGGFYYGFIRGLINCLSQFSPMENKGSLKRHNSNIRLGHTWAMKRMAYLWCIRPALLTSFFMASYWVPKELFAQNFGRRNRRNHFDGLPHLIGSLSAYIVVSKHTGRFIGRPVWWFLFIAGTAQELFYAHGSTIFNQQIDNIFPMQMAAMYGLPKGGENFDMIAGGEHATEWRMESSTESPVQQVQRYNIRSAPEADHHPKFRYDWGHASYSS